AYAYNSQLLVSEGDIVETGQVIAESGEGPQLDGRLHFEIRKDGKPVNPQSYIK
ncbi:MAG: M23 family metallopeptidase, partial [Gammaproteobacteria bacterium]|nr:M23 family metallopeptidase [Gammaproteobacteria bacterium]